MIACLEKSEGNADFHEIFWNTATSQTVNDVKYIHPTVDRKAVVVTEASMRSSLLFNDVDGTACLTNETIFQNLALMGKGQKFSSRITPLFPGILAQQAVAEGEGVNTPRSDEEWNEQHDLIDFVPPTPHDLPLLGGNTPRSDEGGMELIQELMKTCTSLTKRVLALEEAKTAQDKVITRLKLRVRRLEKKRKARTSQPMKRRLFKGRVETSTNKSLGGSTADQVSTTMNVSAATPSTPLIITTIFDDEDLTIAQTLVKMRSGKEKEKGVVFIDEEETPRLIRSTTTLQPLPTIDLKDKGKSVLVEKEPEKQEKVKRKDQGLAQIESDAELAQRLHDEELAALDRAQKERQKQEEATNAALAEEFDEIQARMDADHELAVRLTHEEQEKYTIEERAILYTPQQLKHKSFEEVKKLYEKEQRWINDFKIEENDAEKEELRACLDIVPGDEIAIDFESLATKLVNERYETTSLEGYDLMLWGDLKILFEPSEEDEVWRNQHGYNLISWRLFDSCGVHVLLMDTGIAIHMLIEKKYPLMQEMLSRMFNRRLEVDHESEMAFELLRFTRSQFQK
ncbi:hypothetical protein Tco_0436624 [Tanacetum coccineum]